MQLNAFNNAVIEVTDPAETSFDGTETAAAQTVLFGRADVQHQGRTLRRLQQEHEEADAVVFYEGNVTAAKPQHSISIDYDDGRSAEGTVQQVYHLDDKLLVTLQ